jgi:isoleucyl-tRNA synthetase
MNESKDTQNKSETALSEERILKFWAENDIFQKTLKKPATEGDFIFYEGPPTANGKPGIHHLIARAFKDVIPRYKTMRGFHVERKGGWDTHGLPVEIQVEKQLGLKSKKEVEAYGVEKFNQECKKSVWRYVDLWNDFTSRIGYWVDQENPYITYEKTYMESVWNILKKVSEKKLGDASDKKMIYKDYKVLPWCPRCGTALSSHELAQGYEDVKDLSVYVKFKLKNSEKFEFSGDVFFIAWTTTPWTLPGNVALAVGEKVSYVEVEFENNKYILAEKLLEKVFAGKENYKVTKKLLGKDLLGVEYESLYSYLSEKFADKNTDVFNRAYKVYSADFVTTEDGTGIVHTAVMYGQDDFELGTKESLPKFHLVQEDGHFLSGMDFLSNRFVKEKDEKGEDTLAIDIIKDLAGRNLLFKKEKYTHTYPHCWRCKTPLIYYARDSWYIRMSALRADLVKENETINWHPSHIRDGRFGEWLSEVKDWAISRERYWGTPLPFWVNTNGEFVVIGSVAELKSHAPQRNKYVLVRHGESEANTKDLIDCDLKNNDSLTENGKEEAKNAGKIVEAKKIDLIFTSPFKRAKETAEIIAKEIGFNGEIIEDERIGEIRLGHWNGKSWEEYMSLFKNISERFTKHPDASMQNIENWDDLRARVASFMYDIDARYEGKNILIVGHGGPLNLINLTSLGYSKKEMAKHYLDDSFMNAEVRDIDWRNLPHNNEFEIDLHKPFIDSVELVDTSGQKLTRVKEVLDVWFDSGAMPFAQIHYPFEKEQSLAYPADYISEAIDQTRGWFYTLHAVGALMEMGKAYKNVICLTHILDAYGKKMSKSIGNVVDPWLMMDKYGVDALRLWMFTVNQPGDSKNFDEKTVDEVVKKVFNLLTNIVSFYEMYADESVVASADSVNVLDKWIVTRLHRVIAEGTNSLDDYDVFSAGRAIRDFVGDFSTWYIRRSRDRFKSDDLTDKKLALATTKYILLELSKYMAPFTPFYAENLYKKIGGLLESVHLENWTSAPIKSVGDVVILEDMQDVRNVVSNGLELRSKSNIKVRQPLSKITIKSNRIQGRDDLIALVKDELNVKEVIFDAGLAIDAELDTNISDDLKTEGQMREVVRVIQDLRKNKNLTVGDKARLFVSANESGKKIMDSFALEISKITLINDVVYKDINGEKILIDDLEFVFEIEKM